MCGGGTIVRDGANRNPGGAALAGAAAVQVGTANFVDPGAIVEIIEGIEAFCVEQGIDDVRQLIGSLAV